MDCWIYKDGETESPSITGGSLINLIRGGRLSRFSEIRSAAGGGWQTIESSEFREFLPGEQPSGPPVNDRPGQTPDTIGRKEFSFELAKRFSAIFLLLLIPAALAGLANRGCNYSTGCQMNGLVVGGIVGVVLVPATWFWLLWSLLVLSCRRVADAGLPDVVGSVPTLLFFSAPFGLLYSQARIATLMALLVSAFLSVFFLALVPSAPRPVSVKPK